MATSYDLMLLQPHHFPDTQSHPFFSIKAHSSSSRRLHYGSIIMPYQTAQPPSVNPCLDNWKTKVTSAGYYAQYDAHQLKLCTSIASISISDMHAYNPTHCNQWLCHNLYSAAPLACHHKKYQQHQQSNQTHQAIPQLPPIDDIPSH